MQSLALHPNLTILIFTQASQARLVYMQDAKRDEKDGLQKIDDNRRRPGSTCVWCVCVCTFCCRGAVHARQSLPNEDTVSVW